MLDGRYTVLMTTDTIGGVWSYCLELARSGPFRNVKVHLASMGQPLSRAQAVEAARVSNLDVIENSCKLEWMDQPWADVERAGDWLLELEESFSPNIIHLNGYAHGALPFKAPKLIVAHSCVLSWWHAVRGEPAPQEWEQYRAAVGKGLEGAHAIVAPSRAMLDCLNRFYGQIVNTRTIYNGCDGTSFSKGRRQPMILSAGRIWDEAKNISTLGAIAHSLDWPVYVAGDTKAPEANEQSYSGSGLKFLGRLGRADLAQWYSRASIYTLPARYEPFGLSILEAALSGCALVLGDIASLREIWADAALFVSPNDPGHLRSVLQQLIRDPQRVSAYGSAAFERAQKYSAHAMGQRYLALYRSLLRKPELHAEELAA